MTQFHLNLTPIPWVNWPLDAKIESDLFDEALDTFNRAK